MPGKDHAEGSRTNLVSVGASSPAREHASQSIISGDDGMLRGCLGGATRGTSPAVPCALGGLPGLCGALLGPPPSRRSRRVPCVFLACSLCVPGVFLCSCLFLLEANRALAAASEHGGARALLACVCVSHVHMWSDYI